MRQFSRFSAIDSLAQRFSRDDYTDCDELIQLQSGALIGGVSEKKKQQSALICQNEIEILCPRMIRFRFRFIVVLLLLLLLLFVLKRKVETRDDERRRPSKKFSSMQSIIINRCNVVYFAL